MLPLTGDDASDAGRPAVPVHRSTAQTYQTAAFVTTNGNTQLPGARTPRSPTSRSPAPRRPTAAIYAFWDDLFVDARRQRPHPAARRAPEPAASSSSGATSRFFGDTTHGGSTSRSCCRENGQILTQYRNIADDGREHGNSATLGIENQAGTVAFQYSFNEAVIDSRTFAVLYRLPPSGFVRGTVTDANDDLALAGATVRASQDGTVVRTTRPTPTGSTGCSSAWGRTRSEASATNYGTESAEVVLDEDGESVTQDFALRTARGEVSPDVVQVHRPTEPDPNQDADRVQHGHAGPELVDRPEWRGVAHGEPEQWRRSHRAASQAVQVTVNTAGPGARGLHGDAAVAVQQRAAADDAGAGHARGAGVLPGRELRWGNATPT